MAADANLLNILLQYGIAGLAVYLMYRLMCNHIKSMTAIISRRLEELAIEVKELRRLLEERLSK